MMGRFDPWPDMPYGVCKDCGVVLSTQESSREHMDKTMDRGRGHTISVRNQVRSERIHGHVGFLVSEAINDALSELFTLVERGEATEEEITEALSWHPDFSDQWAELLGEAGAA